MLTGGSGSLDLGERRIMQDKGKESGSVSGDSGGWKFAQKKSTGIDQVCIREDSDRWILPSNAVVILCLL